MQTTHLLPSALPHAVTAVFATILLFAPRADAADLRVMKVRLGAGTVTSNPAGINCGATCDATFAASATVTLTAMAPAGSAFARWHGDCAGTTATCNVAMNVNRSVRAEFRLDPIIEITDFTPNGNPAIPGSRGIRGYLDDNPTVNSPARFVAALPSPFRQNWILMSRSESLQTGTAQSPRILLPSADAQFVFTVGMTRHSSYPGSHPNAIEYMQWDAGQKNFRFHEIVLDSIPAMGSVPARSRGISIDDSKCSKCHSTRNVLNLNRSVTPPVPGSNPGTDGVPPGTVQAKNKPNWDSYDSWGGMLPFNRDRIYQGSVEAAAFRKIFNPWTWRANEGVRSIIEQLQPPMVASIHAITRSGDGPGIESNDGHINFAFDASPPVFTEPAPTSSGMGIEAPITTSYSFNRVAGSGPTTSVTRGGAHVLLHHTSDVSGTGVGVEGRGVQLFDLLGGLDGSLNAQRIADELINHRFATGSVPIDVRPLTMAISKRCLGVDRTTTPFTIAPALAPAIIGFFEARNGAMNIDAVVKDTDTRATTTPETSRLRSLPRRKADIQKFNFDRTDDFYLLAAENGLLQEYGANTTVVPTDTMMDRVRKEVFRRPPDLGAPDGTVMGGIYVDREDYGYNTDRVALYRFFLEPLGVSVDKWSMSVRGRSRSYNFADVFSTYANVFEPQLRTSLTTNPVPGLTNPDDCGQLITAVGATLSSLPAADAVPTFTDVQRIFNKSCIECHGGLEYPPYGPGFLDVSEDENPPATTPPMVSPRLARSYDIAVAVTSSNPATSLLYQKITETSEDCASASIGMMPCGGPPLSKVDVETIRRWIVGPPSRPSTRAIRTSKPSPASITIFKARASLFCCAMNFWKSKRARPR